MPDLPLIICFRSATRLNHARYIDVGGGQYHKCWPRSIPSRCMIQALLSIAANNIQNLMGQVTQTEDHYFAYGGKHNTYGSERPRAWMVSIQTQDSPRSTEVNGRILQLAKLSE